MGNLIAIQTQIEKLQKQAAEIKTKEFAKTVKEIQVKMLTYGITVKDLQLTADKQSKSGVRKRVSKKKLDKAATKTVGKTLGKRVHKPSKLAGKKVAAKYRGPKGETWSGRGIVPRWLTALVAQGKSRESFAIKKDR